ncbi:DUF5994 family protein [Streptomyces jumonjinensis]|uniref:Uncharacterized protein n=1 Tax=Streptomyces jumonjinensis TaxID=1945 RepID=A0A646KMS5_STRJU|nr:DUF5994 family protein [Streptomyces jumonjinensis]MQT03347.1 hypothetical protein [Streptomyces jumonjinensis]
MADSDTPHTPPLSLPDAIHEAVEPGTALLRLETTHSREGVLDGAWWPRTRDIETELPPLISALAEHLGPITRVGVDASAWNGLPTRLIIDGRVVHLDSDPVGDDTVLITRGDQDHFALLVVPPDTTPEAARVAMARAVNVGNITQAAEILIATIPEPRPQRGSRGDPAGGHP